MANLGVTVAVLQGDSILLTKREDLEVWCLPGGGVEIGESLAQAAVRETREETGLDVQITRFVGAFSRLGAVGDAHALVFAAEPIGGALQPQPREVVDIGWFRADALPIPLVAWHLQPILAALQGAGEGLAWAVHISLPQTMQLKSRQALYALRDQSSLSRQTFYSQLMDSATIDEELEVGCFDYKSH